MKKTNTTLDSTQRQYVLNRISEIQEKKIAAIYRDNPISVIKRTAALKVVDDANPLHVRNAFLASLGYGAKNDESSDVLFYGQRVSKDSLISKIDAAARKAAKNDPTVKVVAKIRKEAQKLREVVALGDAIDFKELLAEFESASF